MIRNLVSPYGGASHIITEYTISISINRLRCIDSDDPHSTLANNIWPFNTNLSATTMPVNQIQVCMGVDSNPESDFVQTYAVTTNSVRYSDWQNTSISPILASLTCFWFNPTSLGQSSRLQSQVITIAAWRPIQLIIGVESPLPQYTQPNLLLLIGPICRASPFLLPAKSNLA